jgi:hypothetical protein
MPVRYRSDRDSSLHSEFQKEAMVCLRVVSPYFVAELNAGAGYVGNFSRVRFAR